MERYAQLSYRDTSITGGFWGEKQRMVSEVSVHNVYKRFKETGRFDAMKCQWKPGDPFKPHIFWDSDVAKWVETAAYLLQKKPDARLEALCDEAIDDLEQNQGEDGYFNIWFTVAEPEMRWRRRKDHELYCAGHLMEAAVAYYQATGKRKFLSLMEKYADYIERVFIKERSAAFKTPGHEEIELALVRLYEATGNQKYLDMSRHFVNTRGQSREYDYEERRPSYTQNHLPVRDQMTAEGHCVRALYLYCAMADLADTDGDEGLKNACRTLLDNIAGRRMYITGGVGSTREGEAFTIDYDLPNITAYAESCAALALALFCRRMSRLEPKGLYGDVAERAIYNGFLSSVSLDGKSFFYENPLEIHPELHTRNTSAFSRVPLPITQRVEVFSCSCCPPNITRFIASIADFLYTVKEDALYVHHYMQAETKLDGAVICQKTGYPADGKIELGVEGPYRSVSLRIPGWCSHYTLALNGKSVQAPVKDGYLTLALEAGKNQIVLDLAMEPFLVEAHPNVFTDAGKVAVQRGPVVYCLEAVDNGVNLCDVRLDAKEPLVAVDGAFGVPSIRAKGVRRGGQAFEGLYRTYRQDAVPCDLTFIPYYAFANRGESEMLVWVRV